MVKTLNWKEKLQLQEWIGKGSKTFELLFSIRRDGCNPATFHRLCDSKGPTVTVLYNTNKSVFGGYTSIEWKSSNCYKEDNNAFLFQLRFNGNPKANKFPHRNGKKAIYDGKSYGPYFGSGPDLFTFKNIVKTDKEYFCLNGKMESSTYDMSVCDTEKINNDHMHVKDLEVYQVQDTPVKKWRKLPDCFHWDKQTLKDLKEEVWNFTYETQTKITGANILLLGPIGAGKSSFVNTIYSTFRGYYTPVANSGSAGDSVTTKFHRYSIAIEDKPLPFTLCDTKGLEDMDVRDLGSILDGTVPDGYQFNKSAPFQADSQVPTNLSLTQKIHCVALCLNGSNVGIIPKDLRDQIKQCQKIMNEKDVPQVLILTKVDNVCPLVKNDLSMIFDSADISNLVEETAHVFGLPRGNVLPLKNYEEEHNAEDNVDILTLLNLRQILRFSAGFIQMKTTLIKGENNCGM